MLLLLLLLLLISLKVIRTPVRRQGYYDNYFNENARKKPREMM